MNRLLYKLYVWAVNNPPGRWTIQALVRRYVIRHHPEIVVAIASNLPKTMPKVDP